MADDQTLHRRLAAVLGDGGLLHDQTDMAPYLTDWRGAYRGRALAIARPASTAEVVAVVRLCAEHAVPMVPQGGNTGMCGGATPDATGRSVVIAMGRMNRILEVNPLDYTATVEAGCVLASLQQAATEAKRLFPLSLAAQGSCQIGGNVATNAGGINVLRYGNMRDLTLGIEAVLPDGTMWNGLRSLRKDNTGYDLKQLFIGGEGTLGIVTRVVVKLHPTPSERVTVFVSLNAIEAAVELLARVRDRCGDAVSAFELLSRRCVELVLQHTPGARDPLGRPHPWYVLAELDCAQAGTALRDGIEAALAEALERSCVTDAVVAESLAHRDELWRLREMLPDAIRAEGLAFRSDIAVAIARVPAFVAATHAALTSSFPGIRPVCFGHLGDGNLHFNALPAAGLARPDAKEWNAAVARVFYEVVANFDGSFSAEHGVGQAKRAELARYKDPVEIGLMQQVKHMFDPHNLMNPGKLL